MSNLSVCQQVAPPAPLFVAPPDVCHKIHHDASLQAGRAQLLPGMLWC